MPLEYALFKSENPTNAFEWIHNKMAEIDRARLEDSTELRSRIDQIKKYVQDFDIEFQKVETELENSRITSWGIKEEMNGIQQFVVEK